METVKYGSRATVWIVGVICSICKFCINSEHFILQELKLLLSVKYCIFSGSMVFRVLFFIESSCAALNEACMLCVKNKHKNACAHVKVATRWFEKSMLSTFGVIGSWCELCCVNEYLYSLCIVLLYLYSYFLFLSPLTASVPTECWSITHYHSDNW